MELDLFGHDASDDPADAVEQLGDLELGMRTFVNRWVILAQQRPAALAELKQLIAEAKA